MPAAGGPTPGDERPHPHSGIATFTEAWTFVAGPTPDGLAVEVEVGLRPGLGDAWFIARLTGPGDRVVVVVDHELAAPTGPHLELRAPGLWGDHVVEEPLRRWSLGAEAFGVALVLSEVSGADLLDPSVRGERIPVGWELEWESGDDPGWVRAPVGELRYAVACRVTGEVLVGQDRHEVDVEGHRAHRWGPVASPA